MTLDARTAIPFVDLAAQYAALRGEVDAAIGGVLSRCDFILGAAVQEFEEAFAGFVGARHAVGVGNGLDALRLAMMALDVGPGDEVILPANSYIATALAVSGVGARPVLVDCDAATYTIDPALIEAAITPRTRAIIPVHFTGQSADMDPILEIGRRRGLPIIEDAAQAHGTCYRGRACGSMGIMGCFSFYPGKNLGAYGDAGLVTTKDASLARRVRRLRDYGQSSKYRHDERGLNSRLDTLQAAVLNAKLPHLLAWNSARAAHAERYRQELGGVGDLTLQQCAPHSNHIYHLFMIETDRRDALQGHLRAAGIQTGIHYPKPIHLQKAYRDLGYAGRAFPRAERLARRTLSLPMFPELSDEQIERVATEISRFLDGP